MEQQTLKDAIRAKALEAGFDVVAFTRAELPAAVQANLRAYVADGRHGAMGWMAETLERRVTPRGMWPEAVNAVVLGMNYGPAEADPLVGLEARDRAYVSVYARGKDYHDLVKRRLKQVATWMAQTFGEEVKVFVDTAPVMEKPLAAQAGLGWQGKHTNVVSRQFGSWLFLGEILTTLDIAPDDPEGDHCGSCERCLVACPTGALESAGRIDPRRCVSYLTIEHGGPIPRDLRPLLGNRIYGCDDCLAVCPWNRFARPHDQDWYTARPILAEAPALADMARLDDATFRELFAGSPVKRIKRDRFVRNVLMAIGNSGDVALADVAAELLTDPAPVVRGAAVWALSRLVSRAVLAGYAPAGMDSDPDVQAEWAAALGEGG